MFEVITVASVPRSVRNAPPPQRLILVNGLDLFGSLQNTPGFEGLLNMVVFLPLASATSATHPDR